MPKQNVYVDRLEGYKNALVEHKLKFRNENIIIGDLSQEAGNDAAEQILKMKAMPDGIFVANDSAAVGCMLTLKENGIKIPDDIAVVGFNNDPVSKVIEPNLSTINYNGHEIGEVATRHLISRLNGTSFAHVTNTIILRSELIIRASSLKKK